MISNKILLTISFVLFTLMAMAQFPPPPTPSVPVDGGLSLFAGAAAVYGARNYYKNKKKKGN